MKLMMKQIIYTFLFTIICISTSFAEEGNEVPSTSSDTFALPPAEQAESLQPLSMPNWGNEKNVEGEDFALFLEKEKDYDSAILEWRRVYFESVNPNLKARALFRIGEIYFTQGKFGKSMETFERFGKDYPKHENIAKALYYMTLSADSLTLPEAPLLMARLHSLFKDSPLTEKASYTLLYRSALKGKDNLSPISGSSRSEKLIERLKDYPTNVKDEAWRNTLLSVIPGLGHYRLGDWRSAISAFFINIIFIAALLHSLRRHYWAYSMVFGLIVSILYAGTMFSAHSLTYREALEKRVSAMQKWPDLYPSAPSAASLLKEVSPASAKSQTSSVVSSPLEAPLWFYRNILGRFDGEHGGGAPVSSLYMKQAIEHHGITLGTLMGIDRLIRDWREIETPVARIYTDGRLRYIDPVSRNSFWLEG